MFHVELKLTVFFEDPYWVGIFEITEGKNYCVAKHLFGKEPTDPEIFKFIIKSYNQVNYTTSSKMYVKKEGKINPKRRQREISKLMGLRGTSTKAQEALQKEFESRKKARRSIHSEQRKLEKEQKYLVKLQKKKEKKKGH